MAALAVGPVMERRLMADVAFRARPDPVEDLLASDDPIDTGSLRGKGSTFRGISPVEHLLFADEIDDRTCEFMANVLPISTEAVAAVLADWQDGDDAYLTLFAEGPEGDPLASVDELTNQVIACLTAIDDNGIRDLALAESLDDAHDDLVAASEAVAALKVLMTTEVASQLGITVRFSDADGDS